MTSRTPGEVMSSIPVRDSNFSFFFVPRSCNVDQLTFRKKFKLLKTARRRVQKRPRYAAPGTDCSPGS